MILTKGHERTNAVPTFYQESEPSYGHYVTYQCLRRSRPCSPSYLFVFPLVLTNKSFLFGEQRERLGSALKTHGHSLKTHGHLPAQVSAKVVA